MSQDRERSRERIGRRDRPNRMSEASRDRSTDRGGRDHGGSKTSSNRVYVSNIPYEFRWQDMKDLFREQVGDVAFVEMYVDENDKPKGCGIVEFTDNSSVRKCLDVMQRYEVKKRKLVIKEDSGNMRDKHGNVIGRGGGGDRKSRRDDGPRYRDDRDRRNGSSINLSGLGGDDGKWGQTYGLSPQFLESLGIDPPLSNKVFVANLDYTVDKQKLKDVFRLAGRVIDVELSVDKDGRSRGFAVVEFDHPVEAVQAISMFHNQFLFDRQMTVRLDRVSDNSRLPEGLKSVGMGLGQNGEPLKNVAHNLPNQGSQTTGSGILGAVPGANALQVASALSGLGNVSALGNLNPAVLGAAGLGAGLTNNLLQNGLGNAGDLQALMGQNTNLLAQSQQLSAIQGAGNSNIGNPSSGLQSNLSNMGQNSSNQSGQSSFGGRVSDSYNPNQPITYPTNYGGSSSSRLQHLSNSYRRN
ncbi:myelin expression factor 2 isoform X2 [Anthonomus grandis grandis]|uniref:myelin expression factor 2 isoform X2 n=1 Tax=Anthonomus grandis grandis TaxID=2921223 RepID=UPI002166AF87|nr:myelin expression factor 2 isoform X2 [Anthonomus grandis grandis]